jgi:hypothetical protein
MLIKGEPDMPAVTVKSDWVWMPHPAHFICAFDCRFHLATKVGKYIVSTVGEYFPDEPVREILAKSRGIVLEGRGDARKNDYMRKIGFEEIGLGRMYETMVFPMKSSGRDSCCPWVPADHRELDAAGYNDPRLAYEGHMAMCEKWEQQ